MPAQRAARLHATFGDCWTVTEVVAHVRRAGRTTTAAAVHQRRRRGRLIAFRDGDGEWFFPGFQFVDGTVSDDVTDFLRDLPPLPAEEIAELFVERNTHAIGA